MSAVQVALNRSCCWVSTFAGMGASALLGVGVGATVLGIVMAATSDIGGLTRTGYATLGVGVGLDIAGLVVLCRGIERHTAMRAAERAGREERYHAAPESGESAALSGTVRRQWRKLHRQGRGRLSFPA